jgi:hypothetical protein
MKITILDAAKDPLSAKQTKNSPNCCHRNSPSVSFIAPLHVIFASDVAEWYCFLCRSHFFSTKKIRLALLFPSSTGFSFL